MKEWFESSLCRTCLPCCFCQVYNPHIGVESLLVTAISKASAQHREGLQDWDAGSSWHGQKNHIVPRWIDVYNRLILQSLGHRNANIRWFRHTYIIHYFQSFNLSLTHIRDSYKRSALVPLGYTEKKPMYIDISPFPVIQYFHPELKVAFFFFQPFSRWELVSPPITHSLF